MRVVSSMQHCCIPAASCVSVLASQPQGSVERSLPPVHSRHPGAAREGDSRRPDRRKDAEVWRHPDIPLRDAIFLPALDEDNWQAPRQSPRKPSAHGSPQLWGRGRSQPKVAIPQKDEPSPGQSAPPPSGAAPGAPNKLLRPPPVLAPGVFSGFRTAFVKSRFFFCLFAKCSTVTLLVSCYFWAGHTVKKVQRKQRHVQLRRLGYGWCSGHADNSRRAGCEARWKQCERRWLNMASFHMATAVYEAFGVNCPQRLFSLVWTSSMNMHEWLQWYWGSAIYIVMLRCHHSDSCIIDYIVTSYTFLLRLLF